MIRAASDPMGTDEIALCVAVAFAGVVALAYAVVWFRSLKRAQDLDDRATAERIAQANLEAVAAKVILPNGRPACVVCQSAVATEAWPVIERSWLDKVTALKDLYALTPRYSVTDGYGDEYEQRLCASDKRVIKQKWEEVLAGKRTSVQRLFSQIESELSQLQGGMMLAWARTEHARSASRLHDFLGTVAPLQLAAPIVDRDDGPISMPPMSTKASLEHVEIDSVHQGGTRARVSDDD